jgi:predicted metal-dependent phosphotriesterase family hydrolase
MIWLSPVHKHTELKEYILDYIETTENKDIDFEKVSVSDYHSQNPYDQEQKALEKKSWLSQKNEPSCENDADKWQPDWGRLSPRYANMDDKENNLHLGPIPYMHHHIKIKLLELYTKIFMLH